MGYTDRGFYRWSFIQERSQVSEIAVCQFPCVADLGPEVVVCHKTVDDANAAGRAQDKDEHLLCDRGGGPDAGRHCGWEGAGLLSRAPGRTGPSSPPGPSTATAFELRCPDPPTTDVWAAEQDPSAQRRHRAMEDTLFC